MVQRSNCCGNNNEKTTSKCSGCSVLSRHSYILYAWYYLHYCLCCIIYVREGKFKWMALKKCIKDKVQGSREKQKTQYTIWERERERLEREGGMYDWMIDFLSFLCHAYKVPNPHRFTRHQKYSFNGQTFNLRTKFNVILQLGPKLNILPSISAARKCSLRETHLKYVWVFVCICEGGQTNRTETDRGERESEREERLLL